MTPVYTYKLKRPCGNIRPFCRPCVNSFAIDVIGENDCEAQPPALICVASRIPNTECRGCGRPVAVRLTNFHSFADPGGGVMWPGDYTLWPSEIDSCCWQANLFSSADTVVGPDLGGSNPCPVVRDAHTVYSGTLRLCATSIGGLAVEWRLTLSWSLVSRATDSTPECDTIEGDVIDSHSFSQSTTDANTVTQDPINCSDAFEITLPSAGFGPYGVAFLDLTGV